MLLPHPRPRTVAWLVMRSTVDSHRTTTRCEAHPSDELVVPPGDQVVHLTRLLHREPFQMVTAIQQPGHCLWRVRKPLSPQAPDE